MKNTFKTHTAIAILNLIKQIGIALLALFKENLLL